METTMQDDQYILQVEKICNRYSGEPLLQDVSFSLAAGEILSLLGPSGSGKTTLLRVVAGLEQEESGTIVFGGRDLRVVPPHQRRIGMMFQDYALFPHKSVCQNIAFGLEMQEMARAEQEKKIAAMLELVGLSGFEHRRIDELSGGERQRVALARSLAPEPRLLLLDEPLGSLDRTLRDRLTGEIRAILKTLGVTAIFVTHDQAEAFSVADKVAVLHNGILHQFDTPEQLYRFPTSQLVARFLGFDNFVSGELDGNRLFQSSLAGLSDLDLDAGHVGTGDSLSLLLRPDGARCVDTAEVGAGGPVLSGTVSSCIFLGGSYRLAVLVEGRLFSFFLPIDPPPPQVEQNVSLSLNPASLVLLADNSQERP